jgi:F-type H+-transporting ATPase subunit b
VIEKRKSVVENDLAQAQKFKADTDKAIADYEAALAEARAKAHVIAQDNRNRLAAELDGERAKLDAALAKKIGEAEKAIAASKATALAEVRDVAADIAATIVAELTGTKLSKSEVAEAIAKAAR